MEIRKGKKGVGKRYGFRSSGNINHLRYDHVRRPIEIHVVCPKCNRMAIAVDFEAGMNHEFVGDMSPSWNGKPFEVWCTNCKFKASGLSYFDLPAPYHCIYFNGEKLWAYNWKHLDLIYKFLNGENTDNHEYSFYKTYIHGVWVKNRVKFIDAIRVHVAESDKLHEFASTYHKIKDISYDPTIIGVKARLIKLAGLEEV